MWTHEESIDAHATPARIWALFADVEGWKRWNAGIEQIRMHGPFAPGSTFMMQPPGEAAFTSTLIDVVAHEVFTDETLIDNTCVQVSHRIVPLADGRVRIVYATQITGPAADTFGSLVTADFPDVLRALRDLAEQAA